MELRALHTCSPVIPTAVWEVGATRVCIFQVGMLKQGERKEFTALGLGQRSRLAPSQGVTVWALNGTLDTLKGGGRSGLRREGNRRSSFS